MLVNFCTPSVAKDATFYLKLVNLCKSYPENKSSTFFVAHGVGSQFIDLVLKYYYDDNADDDEEEEEEESASATLFFYVGRTFAELRIAADLSP